MMMGQALRISPRERLEAKLQQRRDERIYSFLQMNFLAQEVALDDVVALPQRKRMLYRGATVPLTSTQFDLCLTLMARPLITFTREMILSGVGADEDTTDACVYSWVKRIRRQFSDVSGGKFDPIVTIYKFGYHWNSNGKPTVREI